MSCQRKLVPEYRLLIRVSVSPEATRCVRGAGARRAVNADGGGEEDASIAGCLDEVPDAAGRSPPATGTAVFRSAFSVATLTLAPWTCRSVSRTDADSAAALFASASTAPATWFWAVDVL